MDKCAEAPRRKSYALPTIYPFREFALVGGECSRGKVQAATGGWSKNER
jgi:hypothetical protein